MTSFNRQSGFTLLEMIIAMGLFAVGIMGFYRMTSGLMENNASARNRADATHLCRSKLETLGRGDYSEIVGGVEEKLDASGVSGRGVFKREVAVDENRAPAYKEVTVTVSWEAKGGHRVVLKTVFAE
jgi:prepilin-type N-terminal cleavage/methylation domain-containing protein